MQPGILRGNEKAPPERGFSTLPVISAFAGMTGKFYSNGTSSSATMLMILISGLMAGPAVSL